MTAEFIVAAVAGAALVIIAVVAWLVLREVRKYHLNIREQHEYVRKLGYKQVAALEQTQCYLHRVAVAMEKAANDRPAQVAAAKHAEESESLVLAIHSVLNTPQTHPTGLKDDVIIGREQAAEEIKEQLRDELDSAMNTTKN